MKKVLLSMAAVGAFAAAAPAVAQYGYQTNANAGGAVSFSNRIAQLDARLRAGIQSGEVDRTEARSLRMRLRQLARLERQYSVNGLTQEERADLRQRLRSFRQDLRVADGGRFDNDTRYGSWQDDGGQYGNVARYDRYGNRDDNGQYDRNGNLIANSQYGNVARYDRYGNRDDNGQYDRNGNLIANGQYGNVARYDRYGNRDDRNGQYDRNGNWIGNDGYSGQGGPYEQPYQCEDRGVIGGVIDSVLGRANNCGTTLRVGQRATGNLYSVPSQYRDRYRDGNGVYYRSDGRTIYQIDARTDTVLRIYDMN
jgi:hypothetical protein